MIQASLESSSLDPPTFNPYDYSFHEDPYPTYRRLREEAPLYHNPDTGILGVVAPRRRGRGVP